MEVEENGAEPDIVIVDNDEEIVITMEKYVNRRQPSPHFFVIK